MVTARAGLTEAPENCVRCVTSKTQFTRQSPFARASYPSLGVVGIAARRRLALARPRGLSDVVARLEDAFARARSSIARARAARKIILDRSRARAVVAPDPARVASPSRARVETPSRRSTRVARDDARDASSRAFARSRVRAYLGVHGRGGVGGDGGEHRSSSLVVECGDVARRARPRPPVGMPDLGRRLVYGDSRRVRNRGFAHVDTDRRSVWTTEPRATSDVRASHERATRAASSARRDHDDAVRA